MPKDNGIGASTLRREDFRFLTGSGNYTDDINVHGQAYVAFARSNVPMVKLFLWILRLPKIWMGFWRYLQARILRMSEVTQQAG